MVVPVPDGVVAGPEAVDLVCQIHTAYNNSSDPHRSRHSPILFAATRIDKIVSLSEKLRDIDRGDTHQEPYPIVTLCLLFEQTLGLFADMLGYNGLEKKDPGHVSNPFTFSKTINAHGRTEALSEHRFRLWNTL